MQYIYSRADLEANVPRDGSAPQKRHSRQRDHEEWLRKWANVRYNPNTKVYRNIVENKTIIPQELVGEFLRRQWLKTTDGTAFAGAEKMYNTLRQSYIGISQAAVKQSVGSNTVAQQYKPVPAEKIVKVPTATAPLGQVQLDVSYINSDAVGGGQLSMVNAIDIYSRFVVSRIYRRPITSDDVVEVMEAFKAANDQHRLKRLQTDNGAENKGSVVRFCSHENIKHIYNAPYHSTANGMIERFHRTIKGYIAKAKATGMVDWYTPRNFQSLVGNYNMSYHTGIEAIPEKVFRGEEEPNDKRYAVLRQERAAQVAAAVSVKKGQKVLVSRRAVEQDFRRDVKQTGKVPSTEAVWSTEEFEVAKTPTKPKVKAPGRITVVDSEGNTAVLKRTEIQVVPKETYTPVLERAPIDRLPPRNPVPAVAPVAARDILRTEQQQALRHPVHPPSTQARTQALESPLPSASEAVPGRVFRRDREGPELVQTMQLLAPAPSSEKRVPVPSEKLRTARASASAPSGPSRGALSDKQVPAAPSSRPAKSRPAAPSVSSPVPARAPVTPSPSDKESARLLQASHKLAPPPLKEKRAPVPSKRYL